MAFVVIYLILSVVGLIISFPIAYVEHIEYLTIITDYFSSLTLVGMLCGFFAILFRIIFKHFYNPDSDCKLFRVPKWEIAFYDKIKLDNLKKMIPDWGNLVGFKKKVNYGQATDPEFYQRFLFENIVASYLHFFTILVSPMIFLLLKPAFYLSLGLPIILIVLVTNILPVMLQRYLRPKLLSLYKVTKRRAERKANKKDTMVVTLVEVSEI